jgi:hypothetical protein
MTRFQGDWTGAQYTLTWRYSVQGMKRSSVGELIASGQPPRTSEDYHVGSYAAPGG